MKLTASRIRNGKLQSRGLERLGSGTICLTESSGLAHTCMGPDYQTVLCTIDDRLSAARQHSPDNGTS